MVFSTSGIYSSPISEIMTCLCFWIYSESILLLFLVWNQIIFQTETTLISFLWLMTQQSHLIYHVLIFFTTANKAYDFSSHVRLHCVFFVCQGPLSIIMDHCRGAIKRWDFRCFSIAVELDQWSIESFWLVNQPPKNVPPQEIGP